MPDTSLRTLFERFRVKGDALALGEAFDASAPELLRIARHLAHDRDEADDIVQATYLTAIEKIMSLERGREPLPWLIGMLVLHAREARRRRGRPADFAASSDAALDALATHRDDAPDVATERHELTQLVARAVAELPERYRAVVSPYLDGSISSDEIAARVGRSPGVVRMQIHRALERLRRALPKSAALAVLGFDRALLALRTRVLERALATQGVKSAGVSAATLTAGAWLMGKKLALSCALVLLAALGAWQFRGSGESAAPQAVQTVVVAGAAVETPAKTERVESATTEASQRSEASSSSSQAAIEVDDAPALVGRVLTHDGLIAHDALPLAGVDVTLIELTPEWVRPSLAEPYAPADLDRSRARTDADGRFRLACTRRSELHALAIDLGGPHGSIRLIDTPLVPEVGADLGDFVLLSFGGVAGRALDERGEPLANVLVRAAVLPLPPALQMGPIEDAPRCAALAQFNRDKIEVAEVPEWLRKLIARVPVPTVRTGRDGRFELATQVGAPLVVLDCEGRPVVRVQGAMTTGKRQDLGDIVLARGRSVKVRVLDSNGTPLADADVLVGVVVDTRARAGCLLFAMLPGANAGEFALDGLRAKGELVFAARHGRASAWKHLRTSETEVELRLDPTATLTIDVTGPDSLALDAVEVELMPDTPAMFARATALVHRGAGHATFEELAPGAYFVIARAPGYAPQRGGGELVAPESRIHLELAPVPELAVQVRDARDRTPIANARVELRARFSEDVADSATTDAEGSAHVRILPIEGSSEFSVRVDHPDYAPRSGVPLPEDGTALEIWLDGGGTLALHVRERGQAPSRPHTLLLTGSALRVGVNGQGDATVERLAAVYYGYELHEGFNDSDAWQELAARRRDPPLLAGSFRIEAGETTELVLELDPDFGASPGKARLRGLVAIDGQPGKDVSVFATRQDTLELLRANVEATGEFDFGWIAAGKLQLQVQRTRHMDDSDLGLWLFRERVVLAPGEERSLDIDVSKRTLEVLITDGDGNPIDDATVVLLEDHGQPVSDALHITGAEGRVLLASMRGGAHKLVCYQHAVGAATIEDVFAAAGSDAKLEVVLAPGVPCEGWLELPPGFAGEERGVAIAVWPEDTPYAHYGFRVEAKALNERVRIAGLVPGSYRISATCGANDTRAAQFELGPAGDRNLSWRLEASGE